MGTASVQPMAEKKKPVKKTATKKAAPKKAAPKKAIAKKVPAKKQVPKKPQAKKKTQTKTSTAPINAESRFEVISDFTFDESVDTPMGELITANDIKTAKTRKKFLSWFKR
jgi:hypothetical protein